MKNYLQREKYKIIVLVGEKFLIMIYSSYAKLFY